MKSKLIIFWVSLVFHYTVNAQFFAPETIVQSDPRNGKGIEFDTDNDGDLDIVQIDLNTSGFIRVYERNGNDFDDTEFPPIIGTPGTFQILKGYADFDNDGDEDIFNGYGWVENDAGEFFTAHYFLPEQHYGDDAFAHDFNGDGFIDVVLSDTRHGSTNAPYHMIILQNNGLGEFTEISSYSENPNLVEPADANHDGWIDLLHHDYLQDAWFIYAGNGDGTFDDMELLLEHEGDAGIFSDLNQDGILDYSYITNDLPIYQGDMHLLYGEPNGGYTTGPVIHIPTWELLWSANNRTWYTLDYDGDDDVDIMLKFYDEIIWIENEGGVFTYIGEVGVLAGAFFSTYWTHLNNDNRIDILETSVSLVGYIQSESQILIPSTAACEGGCVSGRHFDLVDADSNGHPEILTTTNDGDFVLNQVNEFGYVSSRVIANSRSGAFWNFIDYNQDGMKDLIYKEVYTVYVRLQTAPFSFELPIEILQEIPGVTFDLGLLDVDLDGFKDLIVATTNGDNEVYWMKHVTGMNWSMQGLLAPIGQPGINQLGGNIFHEGDFNGDGLMDMAALTNKTCTFLLRASDGSFDVQEVFSTADDNSFIRQSADMVTDQNLDGRDDIVLLQKSMTNIQKNYYLIRFNGTEFQTLLIHQYNFDDTFYGNLTPVWILCDLDGDGDDDLVYGMNQQIRRSMNNITSFTAAQTLNFLATNTVESLGWQDIDADMMPDLLIGGPFGSLGGFVQTAINNLDSPYQINISAFIDYNADGLFNGFDEPLINKQIALSNNLGYAFTDEAGLYTVYGEEESYTLTMDINENLWMPVTPLIQTVELTEQNPTADLVFAITPMSDIYDVQGQIMTMADVCGSDYGHWISIYNAGNTSASGSVTYTLDEGFTYTWADPEPASVVGNVITWNYSDLHFNQSITYTLTAASPGVESIGDTVSHTLEITALDENGNLMATSTDDNTYIIECAYDPNDINENLGWSAPGYIRDDGTLEYTVRFQNLGTAPAVDVRVENILSSLHNHASVAPIASSHSYTVHQDANGHLNFFFENIQLPAAEDDEPASHGFITFRIRPVDGLLPNTEIHHYASIYFDLNPPIVTNEAVNTILDCESLDIMMQEEGCVNSMVEAQTSRTEFISYIWSIDNMAISSGISTSLNLSDSGINVITLEVSNPVCSITTEAAIDMVTEPEINSISEDAELCGNSLSLEVEGVGSPQWLLNGESIDDAFAIEATIPGVYTARLTNLCGSAESTVEVSAGAFPAFESLSDDQILCDESVLLQAAGTGEISWWLGEEILSSTGEFSTNIAGNYRAVVTTSCGTVEEFVIVTEENLPEFTSTFEDMTICDTPITLTAQGNGEVHWYFNNNEIASGTELVVSASGIYSIELTNACGSVTESQQVNQGDFPVFSELSESEMLCNGTAQLVAVGAGNMMWYYGSEYIGSGESITAENTGAYYVLHTTECGAVIAEVNVEPTTTPIFETMPTDVESCGDPVLLSASGSSGESVLWYVDGVLAGNGQTFEVTSSSDIEVILDNMCATTSTQLSVVVHDTPVVELEWNAEDQILLATDGFESYAWSENGVLMSETSWNNYVPQGNSISVFITDENGCTASSSITISNIQTLEKETFMCYPNPTQEILQVIIPQSFLNATDLSMFDYTGKLVHTETIMPGTQKAIFVGNLSSGIYTLMIQNQTQKVIIE